MYLPQVAHVLPLTTIRRQRTLPVPGTIPVHLNERVQPQDVIAEAEVAPQHKFIDVAQGLGLPVREVARWRGAVLSVPSPAPLERQGRQVDRMGEEAREDP